MDNLGFLSRLAHLLGLQRVPLLHQKRYQSINISEHLINFLNTDRTEVHALHARPLEQVDLERVEVTAEHHGGQRRGRTTDADDDARSRDDLCPFVMRLSFRAAREMKKCTTRVGFVWG